MLKILVLTLCCFFTSFDCKESKWIWASSFDVDSTNPMGQIARMDLNSFKIDHSKYNLEIDLILI